MQTFSQDFTHVRLDVGQSALVASFVPDGMSAWYERSNQLSGTDTDTEVRSIGIIPLNEGHVFTGTLGLAVCNPLTDGIQALSNSDAFEGANVHRPGIYTRRLVIGAASNEGN
jgi:hypothetical protein